MPIDADRHALRYGLGVASIFATAQLVDWPFGYMAPLLASMLLQRTKPVPLTGGIMAVVMAFVLLSAAAFWAAVTLEYPGLFLASLAVLLYAVFHYAASGGRMAVVLFATIGILVMPSIARISPDLAPILIGWLSFNLAAAFIGSTIWFAILPPKHSAGVPAPAQRQPVSPEQARWKAAAMLLITYPLVAWFNIIESQNTLTLIFTAILVQQLSSAAMGAIGRALILANVAGGVLALVTYEILVMTPLFAMFAAITTALLLVLGRLIASGKPIAKLAGPAASGFIVLLGGATAPYGSDADAAFVDRIAQIGEAVLYVLLAVTILTSFWRPRAPEREAPAPVA